MRIRPAPRLRATIGLAALVGVVALPNPGQVVRAQLAFDAASIKENHDIERGRLTVTPAGAVTSRHMRPVAPIAFAFELQDYQLTDAPTWLDRTYYDIVARPASKASRAEAREMLRSLLIERFRLKFHSETRELNGFALVRAGSSGPGLRPSTSDCEVAVSSDPACKEGGVGDGSLKFYGAYVASLIPTLINEVHAPIQDRTMLTGNFDIELRWSQDRAGSGDLPALYTALREQLGVKLDQARIPTEMFVIDSIERPAPD